MCYVSCSYITSVFVSVSAELDADREKKLSRGRNHRTYM